MWVAVLYLAVLLVLPIWFIGGMSFFTNLLWLGGFALVAGGCGALMEHIGRRSK